MATESKSSPATDIKPASLKQRQKRLRKARLEIKSNQPSAAEREFANLKQIEARLKHKIEKRIPKFTEIEPGSRDQSAERAQRHLDKIREAIKNHPQNKS